MSISIKAYAIENAQKPAGPVIATARPDDDGFVRKLGAKQVIDHTAGNVATPSAACTPTGSPP